VFNYQKIEFHCFTESYNNDLCAVGLFEQSIVWWQAISQFIIAKNDVLMVHCLFEDEQLLAAWPLVHVANSPLFAPELRSLTCVYSSVSEPLVFQDQEHIKLSSLLLAYICKNNSWHYIKIGPLNSIRLLNERFEYCTHYQKIFSQTDNWYENNIQSFQQYYDARPSRLKNTIKRREKQLVKKHEYQVNVVTSKKEFELFFPQYKEIYQKSWKGEEYSYAFIEEVCLKAIDANKLRFGVLIVNDIAVAAQIWFLQQGTASIFKLAYDPQYKKYSVGSILSMALSQYVIDIDKVHTIEFGMGSEPYKKDWMSQCQKRVTLQIFNHKTMIGNLLAFRYIILSKIKCWLLYK